MLIKILFLTPLVPAVPAVFGMQSVCIKEAHLPLV